MSEGLIMNYCKTINKTSINTNHNRKRLKVSDNPRYSQKHKNKMLRKKDRRLKSTLILLSLVIIVSLSYFNINKRKALKANIVISIARPNCSIIFCFGFNPSDCFKTSFL